VKNYPPLPWIIIIMLLGETGGRNGKREKILALKYFGDELIVIVKVIKVFIFY
jgi:hypothetical protein